MERRILWLTPKWPLPCDDGARVATCSLLRGLTALGYAIDLLAISAPNEHPDPRQLCAELGLRTANWVERGSRVTGLCRGVQLAGMQLCNPWLGATLGPYATASVQAKLRSVIGNGPVALTVFDGLHTAAPFSERGLFRPPHWMDRSIYRAHNVESDLWARRSQSSYNPVAVVALKAQEALVRRFEGSLARQVDHVASVSEQDVWRFEQLHGPLEAVVVPIGADFPDEAPGAMWVDSPELLFVGRLDWPPNRDGLEWFLDRVWSRAVAKRPDLRLTIIGSGDDRWLRRRPEDGSVSRLGRVEVLDSHYSKASACVVPVFYGSGTRVKVIEAAAHGRGCISTALGVDGTGLRPDEDYLAVEDQGAWVDMLVGLTRARTQSLGHAAFHRLRSRFDQERVARGFANLVD